MQEKMDVNFKQISATFLHHAKNTVFSDAVIKDRWSNSGNRKSGPETRLYQEPRKD
jgi:hypothetical protein